MCNCCVVLSILATSRDIEDMKIHNACMLLIKTGLGLGTQQWSELMSRIPADRYFITDEFRIIREIKNPALFYHSLKLLQAWGDWNWSLSASKIVL